jgi:hypothetical protein
MRQRVEVPVVTDPLDRPPPCPECGTTLTERHEPESEDRPDCWVYQCPRCGHEVGENGDETVPLTLRTAPWTAPVLAAVLEVVDQEIGSDRSHGLGVIRLGALRRLRARLKGGSRG